MFIIKIIKEDNVVKSDVNNNDAQYTQKYTINQCSEMIQERFAAVKSRRAVKCVLEYPGCGNDR